MHLMSHHPSQLDTPADRKNRLPKAFVALAHPNYRLYFIGQLVSVAGTWMQSIAQGWLVYQISQSEFMLGLVGFAGAIPVLVVSPWGGVLADALPRRTVLVITQAAAMIMAFILAFLTLFNLVQVWQIILLAVLMGFVNAVDAPVRQSFIVELVNRDVLTNAIAMNAMMFNGARVIGPAIGGVILATLGAGWCFLFNAFSFLAVIACLLLMRLTPPAHPPRVSQPLKQLVDGVRYTISRRDIIGLLMLSSIFGIFGMAYSSQLPAYVEQIFNAGAAGYGLLGTAVGLGAICGSFAVAQFHDRIQRGPTLFYAVVIYSILLLVFALNPYFPLALVLAFGLGLCFMLWMNNMNSLLQLRVSDEMRGRVMSLYTLTFFGLSPFGNLLVGALAESWSLTGTVAVTGFVTGILCLLVFLRIPELRKLS